jgi:HEAT repeat protein
VRIAALEALMSIDVYLAGELAVPLVTDANPEVAAAALTAVAGGAHPGADDLLEDAVKSGDAFVRRAAVRALPARSTVRAAELLAWAACLADPPDLPRLLIESLARIAAADDAAARAAAVTALINLASAAETREMALRAIAALPDTVVDDIARKLRGTRVATKLTAIEALARMRHPRASQALQGALEDEDAAVRRAAVAAFGRLGTRSAAAAVAQLSTSDPDERVRRLATAMCRRHRWRGAAER